MLNLSLLLLDTEVLSVDIRCQGGYISGNESVSVSIDELEANVTIPQVNMSKVTSCDGSVYLVTTVDLKISMVSKVFLSHITQVGISELRMS